MLMGCSCGDFIEETTDMTHLDSSDPQNQVKNFRNLSANDPLVIDALNSLNQKRGNKQQG
jgi:hypothetical protein